MYIIHIMNMSQVHMCRVLRCFVWGAAYYRQYALLLYNHYVTFMSIRSMCVK